MSAIVALPMISSMHRTLVSGVKSIFGGTAGGEADTHTGKRKRRLGPTPAVAVAPSALQRQGSVKLGQPRRHPA